MNGKKDFFQKKDLVLLAALAGCALLLVLFLRLFSQDAVRVCLYYNNELVWSATLSENTDYYFDGAHIEVRDGRARFSENDCPDSVCVNTGWLSSQGEYAVCVPKCLLLKLEGAAADEVDARTGARGGGVS